MRKPLLIAAIALAALAVACSGGSKPKATATAPSFAASPTTPAETVAPAPTVSASPTTTPLAPKVLKKVADVPFPPGLSLVVATGGYRHGEGGYYLVERVYLNPSGQLRREIVFDPNNHGTVTGIEADETGTIFLTLCNALAPEPGNETENLRTQLFVSPDGGITWSKESDIEGKWWVRAAAGGSAMAVNFAGDETRWKLLPAGIDVALPPAASPCCTAFNLNGSFAWSAGNSNAIVDDNGARMVTFQQSVGEPGARVASAVIVGPNLGVTWAVPATGEMFFGLLTPAGAPVISQLRVPAGFDPRVALDDRHLIAMVDYERPGTCGAGGMTFGADPAIVEIDAGTYAFIHDSFYDPACSHGTQRVISLQRAPFARVKTGSDCLNVREQPGQASLSLGCFKDGVLLRVRPQPEQTADGSTWLAVGTPDGRAGWASGEFLER